MYKYDHGIHLQYIHFGDCNILIQYLFYQKLFYKGIFYLLNLLVYDIHNILILYLLNDNYLLSTFDNWLFVCNSEIDILNFPCYSLYILYIFFFILIFLEIFIV